MFSSNFSPSANVVLVYNLNSNEQIKENDSINELRRRKHKPYFDLQLKRTKQGMDEEPRTHMQTFRTKRMQHFKNLMYFSQKTKQTKSKQKMC